MNRADLTGFAVDIGGTKTAAARIERGEIVARLQVATESGAGLEAMIAAIGTLLAELGHQNGTPLGVTVTGRVGRDGNWHAVNLGTLPAINGVPLAAALRSRFDSAQVSNDAVAAAVAEAHFGAGRGADTHAYITVSTGVGGGIVLGGQPIVSTNGLAGHIGFVTNPLGETRCDSGRFGTVESVAGGRAFARAAAQAGYPDTDARAVFDAAHAGADWAEGIVNRSASAVALLCGDLTTILGLESISLGGSIGLAAGYRERVQSHLAQEPALFQAPIFAAELGQNSALLGALALHVLKGKS